MLINQETKTLKNVKKQLNDVTYDLKLDTFYEIYVLKLDSG